MSIRTYTKERIDELLDSVRAMSIVSSKISDSTALGRNLLTAGSTAAARSLLGVTGDSQSLPAAVHLDTVTAPGGYFQGSSAGTTVALGYPIDGFAGSVEVTATSNGSMILQVATYFLSAATNSQGMWYRNKFSDRPWEPWVRIDRWAVNVMTGGPNLNNLLWGMHLVSGAGMSNGPGPSAGHLECFSRGSGDIVTQRFTSTVASSANQVWVRTKASSSSAWTPWIRTDVGAFVLSGTGAPNGVVTATVGTRYVDTAATNGAIEWLKEAGGGNTGWRITNADTGWRRLTPEAGWELASAAPSCDVRRINDVVHARVRVQVAAGATFIGQSRLSRRPMLSLPAGFTCATYGGQGAAEVANGVGLISTAGSNGRLDIIGPGDKPWAALDGVWFQTSWLSTYPYPTGALPGTAVS